MCDKDDGWQKPSLLNCVSNSFLVLQGRVSVYIFVYDCGSFDFSFIRARFSPSAKQAEKEIKASDIPRRARPTLLLVDQISADRPSFNHLVCLVFLVEKSNIWRCKLGA